MLAAIRLDEFVTVHLRHHDVEDDQIGRLAVGHSQRLTTVGGGHYAIAFLLEIAFDERDETFLVVRDHHRLDQFVLARCIRWPSCRPSDA